jgi:hypothetical protein
MDSDEQHATYLVILLRGVDLKPVSSVIDEVLHGDAAIAMFAEHASDEAQARRLELCCAALVYVVDCKTDCLTTSSTSFLSFANPAFSRTFCIV